MEKIAIFPGSFDPFTIGHESIVRRSMLLFDRVVIMIGYNSDKEPFFPLKKRLKWIHEIFRNDAGVTVRVHEGLTVDFCRNVNARFILRGIRTSSDFEYERAIAQVNKQMYPDLETVFLLTLPEHTPVKSSIVRDIIRHGGDAGRFIPACLNPEEFKINHE